MKKLIINGIQLLAKDYYCNPCESFFEYDDQEEYIQKDDPKLWLYVNTTNRCNAGCLFCINQTQSPNGTIDLLRFEAAIKAVSPWIGGISFTGGEPMLFPDLIEQLIIIAEKYVTDETEFDLVTNGTNLLQLSELSGIERFSTIHISRHAVDDDRNRSLMRFDCAPSLTEIKNFVKQIRDPGAVVFNCVMQKEGVKNASDVAAFLDMAIDCGVQNTSFITMIKANTYCEKAYVSPFELPFVSNSDVAAWNRTHDSQFSVWHSMHDYEYCHCITGDYANKQGCTRFYFRCPGNEETPKYCRQLVYTPDNALQDGFGSNRLIIMNNNPYVH